MTLEGILVVGFGPFRDVVDNPAARLARALDGAFAEHPSGLIPIVGRVIPVTWRGCLADTLRHAEALRPRAVLGVGVAQQRLGLEVERTGRRWCNPALADVDGVLGGDLEPGGAEERHATAPVAAFARALGGTLSDDAGGYVCNAWLYQAVAAFPVPVGFLHIPPEGADVERVRRALGALV